MRAIFLAWSWVWAFGFAGLFAEEPTLHLKDGDVWVMAGDSITAQRLHTNYLEAFFRARHPQWHLHFRNSGVSGNLARDVLNRFDHDVAAWKPTIVSVELGMNDVNSSDDTYLLGMKELIARIRALPAQPVLISASPVDDGSMIGKWQGERCRKLHDFTVGLKKLAAQEHVFFVDQYHPLLDLWGRNRRMGGEFARKNGTSPPKGTLAPGAVAPSLVPLGGDAVHPGPVGQYTMAAAILEGLKVDGDVSSATLSAEGQVFETKHCAITEVKAQEGRLTFARLDEYGPWPIAPEERPVLTLFPQILKLSRYLLKVQGLPEGDYRVSINGKEVDTLSARDLAAGWNLTTAFDGVIGERANHILALLARLQGPLNNEWRGASYAKNAERLAAAQKAIDDAEAEIQAAIQPVPLRFEIEK